MTSANVYELMKAFPNYQKPDRVRDDVLELSKTCKTLVPRRGTVAVNSKPMELLMLHGTFPMVYQGVTYNTPVQIYITEDYPKSPPLCYIVPSAGMSLRAGHRSVDGKGLVSLPCLREWSAESHSLVELVNSLSSVFGAEPPGFGSASEPSGTLQVVCPGYGRTGTTSMLTALEMLGFGPCYHTFKLYFAHPLDHPKLWLDGYRGRGLDVKRIFQDYKSVTDWPAADFYKEILAANPDAKVVLTVRDPDAWWKSLESTISFKNPIWNGWGYFFLQVFSTKDYLFRSMTQQIKTLHMGEEAAKADYARHNMEVRAHVPAANLLEFSVAQGWQPLCKFLDVPVPDAPFPEANAKDEMTPVLNSINRSGWWKLAMALTVAGASVAAASYFGGKRAGGALAATEAALFTTRIRKVVVMRRAAPKI